jgi:hypothetical protein
MRSDLFMSSEYANGQKTGPICGDEATLLDDSELEGGGEAEFLVSRKKKNEKQRKEIIRPFF